MKGPERRAKILELLKNSSSPLSGNELASLTGVSRQVIVQDIALLRANGSEVVSTINGYVIEEPKVFRRVFKVRHSDEQVEEEMDLFVDNGCVIEDVFIYHKVYGTVRAEMNISTRADVAAFLNDILTGKSSLLKNVTSGYHYHTVTAKDEASLDRVMDELQKRGFLAPLKDYEPVEF